MNHSEGTVSPTGPSEVLQALSPLTCVLGSSVQSVALHSFFFYLFIACDDF